MLRWVDVDMVQTPVEGLRTEGVERERFTGQRA
jgi:hypothetical protein